jgi:hypothetical protein
MDKEKFDGENMFREIARKKQCYSGKIGHKVDRLNF